MSDVKVKKVCKHCGSENVLADAYAQWNVEKQEWEIANVFDKGSYCNGKCNGECRIIDVPVNELVTGQTSGATAVVTTNKEEEEIISVPFYAQHCILAGKRCWDKDMIESESGDISILRGTRKELLDCAEAYENGPNNSNGLYWRKVAKTIREELE